MTPDLIAALLNQQTSAPALAQKPRPAGLLRGVFTVSSVCATAAYPAACSLPRLARCAYCARVQTFPDDGGCISCGAPLL